VKDKKIKELMKDEKLKQKLEKAKFKKEYSAYVNAKRKKLAVILSIAFWITVIIIISNSSCSEKTPKPNAIVSVDAGDATIICDTYLKNISRFGYKSSSIMGARTWKITTKKHKSVWLVKFPVQYQNQFGAYRKMLGVCRIKTKGTYSDVGSYSDKLVISAYTN